MTIVEAVNIAQHAMISTMMSAPSALSAANSTPKGCTYLKLPHLRQPKFRGNPAKKSWYNETQVQILATATARSWNAAVLVPARSKLALVAHVEDGTPAGAANESIPPVVRHITMKEGDSLSLPGGIFLSCCSSKNRRANDDFGKTARKSSTDRTQKGMSGKCSSSVRNYDANAGCDDCILDRKDDPRRKDEGRDDEAPAAQAVK